MNKLNSKFILMAVLIIIVLCVPVSSYPDLLYKAYSRFKYGSVLDGVDRKFILKDEFYILSVKGKSYYLMSTGSEDSGLIVTFGKVERKGLKKYTDEKDINYLYEDSDCIVINYPNLGGLSSEYAVINFKNSFTLLFSGTIDKTAVDVKEYCEIIAERPDL